MFSELFNNNFYNTHYLVLLIFRCHSILWEFFYNIVPAIHSFIHSLEECTECSSCAGHGHGVCAGGTVVSKTDTVCAAWSSQPMVGWRAGGAVNLGSYSGDRCGAQ